MADIRVEKCFYDLSGNMNSWGILTSAEIPYLVFGATEEKNALDAVYTASAAKIENLKRDTLEIDERLGEDIFKVRVNYTVDSFDGTSGDNDPEPSFSFDTGGGSKHISQSIGTVLKVPATAPDFGGAIEVDNDGNVNGVDITMPVMNFSETHYFRASKVSTKYKKRLAELTGTVNDGAFKGYASGEVLFLGASGTRRGTHRNDDWEITFRFAVSPNRKSLKIGSLTIPEKYGWDYLWVRYGDDLSSDSKSLIKKPESAYVERVYQAGDFGGLGIGR